MMSSTDGFAQNPATGTISGHLVDSQSGEDLIGANVYLENTTLGAATDLEGRYQILKVPVGDYTLIISSVSYTETKIINVRVSENGITKLDVAIDPEIMTSETIVVEAKVLENTDASLLKSRQKSNSISDAVSAETISRTASVDAADAMKTVTGASVIDGKYVYIRGLGERYSNTQLNGAELPSSDPDKKAFQMDIVPSKLLDNIVTSKTFTPDEPGNFSGGLVNINTKAFPEQFYVDVSAAMSYNSLSTFNNKVLTYNGSSTDWRGLDDGLRTIPQMLQDPAVTIPDRFPSSRNYDQALQLDAISKSFNPEWAPYNASGPMNQNYSVSIGDKIELGGNPFGFYGSITYSNQATFYENGQLGRWQLSGNVAEVDALKYDKLFTDAASSEEVLVGAMGTFSYQLGGANEFTADIISTQSGTKSSRYLWGEWPDQLTGDNEYFETSSLLYTERNLNSYQLKGKHHISALNDLMISWLGSLSTSTQDEPDLRYFSDTFRNTTYNGRDTTYYAIDNNLYNYPSRYWRNLNEDKNFIKADFELPFKQWNQLSSKFKFGAAYTGTDRQYQQRHFEFRQDYVTYTGDPDLFFSQTGIVDSSNTTRIRFGNYAYEVPSEANNYNGDENIAAAYAMFELPLSGQLRFVGGARYETTKMTINSLNTTVADLDVTDWLPAASLIWQLSVDMNLRFAYGKTLARPTLRELSPLRTYEFMGDFLVSGNPNLKRSLINNFDLRWEMFDRPGEIFAVSGFYKVFSNPIERLYDIESEKYTWDNVDNGLVYGAEFEIRKSLDFIGSFLSHFMLNSNLSLIRSEVKIPDKEFEKIKQFDDNAEITRPLYGQSPYIINIELMYANQNSGTSASILYNVFGERLSEVVYGATPDVYERPQPIIDLIFAQRLSAMLTLRAGIKNLLESEQIRSMSFKGKEYVYHRYGEGRIIGIGLNFSI
jgi:TonB-dependent receptor